MVLTLLRGNRPLRAGSSTSAFRVRSRFRVPHDPLVQVDLEHPVRPELNRHNGVRSRHDTAVAHRAGVEQSNVPFAVRAFEVQNHSAALPGLEATAQLPQRATSLSAHRFARPCDGEVRRDDGVQEQLALVDQALSVRGQLWPWHGDGSGRCGGGLLSRSRDGTWRRRSGRFRRGWARTVRRALFRDQGASGRTRCRLRLSTPPEQHHPPSHHPTHSRPLPRHVKTTTERTAPPALRTEIG